MFGILSRIERAARNDDLKLALRLCLKLGARAECEELVAWARLELDGYKGEDIPNYRQRRVTPLVTARLPGGRIAKNFPLQDPGAELLLNEHGIDLTRVELRQPILELRQYANGKEDISIPHEQVGLIHHLLNEHSESGVIDTIKWPVSRHALSGICSQVSTTAYELAVKTKARKSWYRELPASEIVREIVIAVLRVLNST